MIKLREIMNIKNILLLLCVTLLVSGNAHAAAPSCHSGSGGYCQYTGKVKRLYVNTGNIILLYFEESITPADAAVAGVTITNGGATAFNIATNPEFAKMFYSTALAAQASNRNVTIQMRGNQSGYLKFDRIWLSASE